MADGERARMKVLMLPGYTQNGTIFSKKIAAVRKACKNVDMVFMDPPHVVHEPTFANTATQQFDSTAKYGDGAAPEETPRAWWHAKEADGWKHYEGVREALTSIREALETQGPFDGVFGFSQGAAMAAIVAAVLAHPERVDESKLGSVPKHPKLKFAVCVAGFLPLDPQLQSLFKEPVDSTSLQVLGRGDTLVGEDRSLPLVKAFKNPRVEWHDGGHFTPSKASWRNFFRDYMASFEDGGEGPDGVPSPGAIPDSGTATPASGAVTPSESKQRL